ncbi:arylesterase [Motiliproteus sp.]|uniref:arylesterase n=1 Tax=Motiliproteus sp. TaxID=1898955 RepID=UPI003BAAD36C
MKRSWLRITGWLLWSLVLCGALNVRLATAAPVTEPREPVLLILGDSISAGYGLEPGRGWTSLLEQRLSAEGSPLRVINASVSGDTTSGGLSRLPSLLQQYRPQVLVIELGGNDGLRGTPLKLIESNLHQLVALGQQSGAEVVLLGMRIPPNYGPRYSNGFYQLFSRVGEASGIAYLPFFLEGIGGVPELMQADGIHPNTQAQPKLLELAWRTLAPLLASP